MKAWYWGVVRGWKLVPDHNHPVFEDFENFIKSQAVMEWGEGTEVLFDRDEAMVLVINGKRRELIECLAPGFLED